MAVGCPPLDELAVGLHLHFVAHNARLGAIGVDPTDLVDRWGAGEDCHRVVELRDAPPGSFVADLCAGERELPEIVSLLVTAEEVHLHGLSPRIGLHMLPYVKPETLTGTRLVVHGPWPRVDAPLIADVTRMETWPGPVVFDALARRSHLADLEAGVEVAADTAARAELAHDRPAQTMLDPHAARLLPRPGGPRPHQPGGAQGRPLAIIAVSSELADAPRDALLAALAGAELPGLDVELWDERAFRPDERATARRQAQAFVAPVRFHWSSSLGVLEAMAAAVPLVALGEALEAAPPGIVHVTAPEDAARELLVWADAWAKKEAAPTDVDAARAWLLERALVGPTGWPGPT